MIHPGFYDDHGNSLPPNQPLPMGVEIPARMVVLVDGMRETLHRSRIREGVRFYCYEWPMRVAEGRVTKITGLFNEHPKHKIGV